MRSPLPFLVIMMMPELKDAFRHEGFPATYFIGADGEFSSTLFGDRPGDELRRVVRAIALEGVTPNAPESARASSDGAVQHPPWEKRPIVAIHSHMAHEAPRILFLRFWAKGSAATRARGINAARTVQESTG